MSLRLMIVATVASLSTLSAASADSAVSSIRRVSVTASGVQGNSHSTQAVFSPDGTRMLFESCASNLVPGDTNGACELFVKSLTAGTIRRVAVSSGGVQANDESYEGKFSPDGNSVIFTTWADNLVKNDFNEQRDVFVKNLKTGAVRRVSETSSGGELNDSSYMGSFSPDGKSVAFVSNATNPELGTFRFPFGKILVKRLDTGKLAIVSTSAAGKVSQTGNASNPSFSPDGKWVLFTTTASDLGPTDNNVALDIYMKSLVDGKVKRISQPPSQAQADRASWNPSFSADGKFVVFQSEATNLVPKDTNGTTDIFVRTLAGTAMRRISVSSSGAQANGDSGSPRFAPDGNAIVFTTTATNFGWGDPGAIHIEVASKRLDTGVVSLLSTTPAGRTANNPSSNPVFSPDGRSVAFESSASNLVAGDTNGKVDIFLVRPR